MSTVTPNSSTLPPYAPFSNEDLSKLTEVRQALKKVDEQITNTAGSRSHRTGSARSISELRASREALHKQVDALNDKFQKFGTYITRVFQISGDFVDTEKFVKLAQLKVELQGAKPLKNSKEPRTPQIAKKDIPAQKPFAEDLEAWMTPDVQKATGEEVRDVNKPREPAVIKDVSNGLSLAKKALIATTLAVGVIAVAIASEQFYGLVTAATDAISNFVNPPAAPEVQAGITNLWGLLS